MSEDQPAANDNGTARPPAAPPPPDPSAPISGGGLLAMIERLATNPSLNLEVFDRLLKARREEEDRAAERAFNRALSEAKGEIEPILKKREVDFVSKDPAKGRTRYKYEEFADVARVIDPVFAKYGLSYRFDVWQEGNRAFVAAIVSHADGYSRQGKPLEGSSDVPPGTNMNPLQALGSALTYLQRYALRAAIGLAAGRDDDALSLSQASAKVTAEQANELQRLIDETGRSQVTLLMLLGAETVADMTVDQWTRAKQGLQLAKAEQRKRHADPGLA